MGHNLFTLDSKTHLKYTKIVIFINLKSVLKQAVSLAQWIEHPPPKGRITGSTPVEGATSIMLFFWCILNL